LHEIDHTNPKTRAQLLDGRLEVFLIKKVPGKTWETLEVQSLTKQEIMQRRNASVDRYYKLQEELEKKAGETKLAHEKKVIDEQMDLERHERKTIKRAKKAEL